MSNRQNMIEASEDGPIEAENIQLAKNVIHEISKRLQQYVYVREEGEHTQENALVCIPFIEMNNLIIEVAQEFGIKNLS